MNGVASIADEIEFKSDGLIVRRAHDVLDRTVNFMEEIGRIGLMESIERAMFADISRSRTGGKGFEGLVEKGENYFNPVESTLTRSLGLA
jgi:beta-lysine 5,6-aminomutase alpha subunit